MVTAFCLEGEVCVSTTNRNINGRIDKGGIVHLMSTASAALIEALAAKVKK